MTRAIFFLPLLLVGCTEQITKEYYANGQLSKEYSLKDSLYEGKYEEYYDNGDKKVTHLYKNGVLKDSSVFYQNNKISRVDYYFPSDTIYRKIYYPAFIVKEEGKLKGSIKVGKWKYNRKDGSLDKVFEYVNLQGKQYTNQGWHFDEKGDTIKEFGNFFSYKFSDEIIYKNKPFKIYFKYKPILALNPNIIMCLSPKINENFSNLAEVSLDTLYFENAVKGYQEIIFSNSGKKILRGFIKEYYTLSGKTNESKERYMYFDIPVQVN
jgi:antitoxin component YwqK of YwqJK toxin-antitoxin module